MIRRAIIRFNKDNDKIIGKYIRVRNYYCSKIHSNETTVTSSNNTVTRNEILDMVNKKLSEQDKKINNLFAEFEIHRKNVKYHISDVETKKHNNVCKGCGDYKEKIFIKPDI